MTTALVDFGIKYKMRERDSMYRPSGREEEAGRCSHRENSRIPLSPFSSEMVLLGFPSAWFGERRAVNTSLLPDWPACLTKKVAGCAFCLLHEKTASTSFFPAKVDPRDVF